MTVRDITIITIIATEEKLITEMDSRIIGLPKTFIVGVNVNRNITQRDSKRTNKTLG